MNGNGVTKKQMNEQVEALDDLLMFLEFAWKRGLGERDAELVRIIDHARMNAALMTGFPKAIWNQETAERVLEEAKEAFGMGAERLIWIDPAFKNRAYREAGVE